MSSIDSLKESALGETSAKYWEKAVTDMNNIDETFANARDLGQLRLNYSRLTVVGKIASFDSIDIYKTSVLSKRGKLSLSLMTASDKDKVLDLSKYETALNELKQQFDPVGYAEEQAAKRAEEAEKKTLEYTAPGMRIEVYTTNRQGKQILVADSAAEKGSKEYEAAVQMLSGEYAANRGDYYIKVSKDDSNATKDEVSYAMQIKMGTTYKHDYVAIEKDSEDTKNKKESKIPLTTNGSGTLSSANALAIQASRYEATANMLVAGYQNMASIYNKNNKF